VLCRKKTIERQCFRIRVGRGSCLWHRSMVA
jgi:hypothetical protein